MMPREAICWDHVTGIFLAQAAAIIASYGACSGNPSCPLATLMEAGASWSSSSLAIEASASSDSISTA